MERQRENFLEGIMRDKWFFLSIILLAMFFLFKLINQSHIVWQFPLDQNNDISVHLGQLHFLKQYGFHNSVPNWYNGYTLFLNYPIAWYFLTLPLYALLGNILLATFISHILLYIAGLLFFLLLGKVAKLSFARTAFFYLVFFVNPVAVGNFIKLGRMTELTGMVLFIAFFALLLCFREKPIKIKGTIAFALTFAAIIFSHPSWTILAALLIPSFFFLQDNKNKMFSILALFLAVLITSFWLFPFLFTAQASTLETFYGTIRLFNFKNFLYDNIISFVLPIFMWFAAFFYFKTLKKLGKELKKELIFYSLPLLVSFLYITRLIVIVPIINRPYPDSYNMFFIFFSMFFLVKTPLKEYGKLKRLAGLFLVLLPFTLILPSIFAVSNFRLNNEIDKQIISLLPNLSVDDKVLIEKMPYPTSPLAFYSYAAVYYNLSTPSGWVIQGADTSYFDRLYAVRDEMENKDCIKLLENLKILNATALITYKDYCYSMQNCGMKLAKQAEDICLLSIFP